MTIMNSIRATLDNRLQGGVGLPAIAPQNVQYIPTTNTSFIRSTFIPTVRRPAVRGLNPQQRYDGLYQVLICTPEGLGSGPAYTIADTVLALFEATTDINHPTYPAPNVIVSIDYSELDNSFLDSPFYCTPINIAWYCYAN